MDTTQLTRSVTRVEVIDSSGRAYTEYDAEAVVISIQDEGRTLKVFLENKGLIDKLKEKQDVNDLVSKFTNARNKSLDELTKEAEKLGLYNKFKNKMVY